LVRNGPRDGTERRALSLSLSLSLLPLRLPPSLPLSLSLSLRVRMDHTEWLQPVFSRFRSVGMRWKEQKREKEKIKEGDNERKRWDKRWRTIVLRSKMLAALRGLSLFDASQHPGTSTFSLSLSALRRVARVVTRELERRTRWSIGRFHPTLQYAKSARFLLERERLLRYSPTADRIRNCDKREAFCLWGMFSIWWHKSRHEYHSLLFIECQKR